LTGRWGRGPLVSRSGANLGKRPGARSSLGPGGFSVFKEMNFQILFKALKIHISVKNAPN
jgi:hypothetical protein